MTTMRGFVYMENVVDLAFKWASLHGWDRNTEESDAKHAVEAVLATPPGKWRAHPTFYFLSNVFVKNNAKRTC